MRREDRLISRLRHIQQYGERAKSVVRGRRLDEMEQIEIEGLCYLVLILTEATIQALALEPIFNVVCALDAIRAKDEDASTFG